MMHMMLISWQPSDSLLSDSTGPTVAESKWVTSSTQDMDAFRHGRDRDFQSNNGLVVYVVLLPDGKTMQNL